MRKSRLAAAAVTESGKLLMRREYESGETTVQIAAKNGFSASFVRSCIIAVGGAIRPSDGHPKLSPEQQVAMIADYQAGMTTYAVADKYGIKECSAWEFLKRRNLTRSNTVSKRIYSHREDAFDTITEESAYWAGFMMTDGCVSCGKGQYNPTIILQLQKRDAEHIYKFREFLKAEHPAKHVTRSIREKSYGKIPQQACFLSIRSPRLAKSLAALGVTERKTHTAKASDSIALNRHFWRGCIDGDGTVYFRKTNGVVKNQQINLCGASTDLLQQFLAFVRTIYPSCKVKMRQAKGCYAVQINGRPAVSVISCLYGDCTIALERKLAKAQEIINHETAHVSVRSESPIPE